MFAITGYTPTELLHQGAGTVIYRSYRDADLAKVIIKSHRSEFPTGLDRAKLRHEHALLSELSGPGIVAVHPLFTSGGRVAIVMEDVGLGPLDRMAKARLDLGLALRIVIGVTSVLARAHQRGIIHKDIKPHNILVGTDPLRVYLIDWGIASRLREVHETEDGAALPEEGTLAYLAPEQTGLMNRAIDARADLYSLGVTFYELLTGVLPFTDESPTALLHSHLTRLPRPPCEASPRVPVQVSEIVMKLLAKRAEDRYANAHGLSRDLAECLSQWEDGGQIGAFPLGRYDRLSEFRIPERLYGREADVAAVLAALGRAQEGASELLLLTGHGGIGKSAIVREARGPMRLRGASVAAGKFEQFRDAAPYASLVRAFQELIRTVMTQPTFAVEAFRAQLLEALGQNVGVMIELIPDLDRLLGPQPPVPELGPTQAENRFNLVMQRFLSVFTRPEHPLVLFLDDLQWAEPASLKLLSQLITDRELRHLLIIGAYRDHDAEQIHLLVRTLSSIAEAGGTISKISLQPLDASDVHELVADTLHTTTGEVAALGQEIYKKTQGNPFFVGQFLTSLSQDGLIAFDEAGGRFQWDLPAIVARAVTENVADFMAERLRRLAPRTLSLLKLGACLGTQFDHATLAKLAGEAASACSAGLWDALVEGLLVPLHEDYRLLSDLADTEGASDAAAVASRVTYRFLHDRVQEAAYSLLEEQERPRLHLEIAKLLRARHTGEIPDDSLFSIVDHLNIGHTLVTGREERLAAAAMNLRAGRRAKASAVYTAARSYLSLGIAYLPEDAWDAAYELSFALHKEQAASVALCGDFNDSAALFDGVLARARSLLLETDIHIVRVQLCMGMSRFGDALRIGMMALSALGAPLPETEAACQAAFEAEIQVLRARLDGRSVEELLDAAPMGDPRAKAVLRLLFFVDAPSFADGQPKLSALATLRQVLFSLEHGPTELSACGVAACGLILLRMFGKSPEVDLLSALAAALEDRYPCPEYAAKLSFTRANADAITRPPGEAVASYDRAGEVSLQYGDLGVWLAASNLSLAFRFLGIDEELGSLKTRLEQYKMVAERRRQEATAMGAESSLQAIAVLREPGRVPGSFDDEHFDEAAFLARAREKNMVLVVSFHWFYKLMVLCVHAEHEAAIPLLEEAEERQRVFGQVIRAQCAFFICLHITGLLEQASRGDAPRYWAMFEECQRTLTSQRALCEEAWRSPCLLVKAERARLLGQDMEAQRLYNQAIDLAQQDGYVRLFAQGNELYGKFSAKRGFNKVARVCLSDAYQAWLSWGAVAKADALSAQFPKHITQLAQPRQTGRPAPTTKGTATVALQGVLFDLGEAMRAASAISDEIMADQVIEQFLRASSQSAAARRTVVALVRGDELMIAGQLTTNPDALWTAKGRPIPITTELCESVARYVARSRELVILGDTDDSAQFTGDPYLREHRPKSLLCLPLIHHDRLLGVWYAESDATSQLRQGSIELLQLLAGHAASALENARLYEQLMVKSGELSDKNQRLETELFERERIERERSALHERVIQMQEELVLELSTPLIPISERVIVVPIVGTIGEKRQSHMVETILAGAHERRASAVIIDITGLRHVDDVTTSILRKTASALRLLGVRVVLTGVRPDVARAVVNMGVELSGIVVRSTLQAGIAFATGEREAYDARRR